VCGRPHQAAPLTPPATFAPAPQGEQLNTIQDNVQRAANFVGEGKKHLAEAKVLQAKSRRRVCIVAAVAVVVLIIVVLVVVLKVRAAAKGAGVGGGGASMAGDIAPARPAVKPPPPGRGLPPLP
jgi:hypothetical protein